MLKMAAKISGIIIGLGLVASLILVVISPYKNHASLGKKCLMLSVEIDRSKAEVFTYLGNSDNAKDWSSYVHHITPLNPNEKQDGELGALRRCFTNADESGPTWDEEILEVKENSYRRLSCYNFQNFTIYADNLQTEQIYQDLGNGSTRLSFTLFFFEDKASMLDQLKMYYASFEIASIFEANLKKIRSLIESEEND